MTPVMGTTYYTMDPANLSPGSGGYSESGVDEDVLKNYVKHQIEYYFSSENLQRDFFLRRKMDNEGYLPISLVASFNRVQQLTQEISFIVESVESSEIVEVKDGSLIRPKDAPLSWPLQPTDLNPNVPEFVPTTIDEEDTAGTDGDDESEEDDNKVAEKESVSRSSTNAPAGLNLNKGQEDGRERLAALLDTPSPPDSSSTALPADWVVVKKKSKEERVSVVRELDSGEQRKSLTIL